MKVLFMLLEHDNERTAAMSLYTCIHTVELQVYTIKKFI